MGAFDWLMPWRNTIPGPEVTAVPILDYLSTSFDDITPSELWRTQPHLRTVVDFIARQVAQLGIHTYRRDSDDGRTRVRDSELAQLMQRPNPDQTTYELVRGIVSDLAVYDSAYLILAMGDDGWELRPLRPGWVKIVESTPYAATTYAVAWPGLAPVRVPASSIIAFHGWNPTDELRGMSPVATLRAILTEQMEAQSFRLQMWARGGRIGSFLTRPVGAGSAMSPEARLKFQRQFNEAWTGRGEKAGGVPLLDEGIELKTARFNAKEEQWAEAAQLSLRTVASVYHVQPAMVGDTAGVSYANVREFRKMLYGETLGPMLMLIEQRLNLALGHLADGDEYVEFNVEARLRGDAEEQAAVLQTGIGGPYMTINEGRARLNMPAIDGGDDLIRPLNVTAAGDPDPIPADPDNGTPPDDPLKAVFLAAQEETE